MAVTFTPNIALAKPTDSELALEWARSAKLMEDNNIIIQDRTNIVLTSYTPTIIAQTTNPNLGAGSIRGEYQNLMGYVFGHFSVEFLDAGIVAGSGEYGISLPFVVDGTFHTVGTALNNSTGTNSVIGEGYCYDNSAIGTSGSLAIDVVTIAGVSYARLITETFTGKTSRVVTSSMPFVPANKDKYTGNFIYRKV